MSDTTKCSSPHASIGDEYKAKSPNGREHRIICGRSEGLQVRQPIAAVIADPPYSSGATTAAGRQASPDGKYINNSRGKYLAFAGDVRDQKSWTRWMAWWMGELWVQAQPSTYLFVFSDWRQLGATQDALQMGNWWHRGISVWDKGRGARVPHQGYMRHQAEYVCWATAGKLPVTSGGDSVDGVLSCRVDRKKVHMTQKPVSVYTWLLGLPLPEGVIVDPFAGSLTALFAADEIGRSSVVAELHPGILSQGIDRLVGEGWVIDPE